MTIIDFGRNLIIIRDAFRTSLKETLITVFRPKEYRLKFEEARMLIIAHSLEKGMGLKDTKMGYGKRNAHKLCDALIVFQNKHPSSIKFCFIESFGILEAYIDFQNKEKVDITDIEQKYMVLASGITSEQRSILNANLFGMRIIPKAEILMDDNSCHGLFSARHSARDFDDSPLTSAIIDQAVALANNAPSACNRQPVKVYCALGREKAKVVNNYLTGNKSFTDNVNNFAIITCDRAYFAGDEQFQWYINGGIYLAYFVNALHSLGIGSCIMQWFAFSKNEKALKELFGISKSEAIIAVVCMGYYSNESKYLCAQRKNPNETVIYLN